jgi:hypothetical protein
MVPSPARNNARAIIRKIFEGLYISFIAASLKVECLIAG